MAYFSHAFRKTFVQSQGFAFSGSISDMGVGELGFFDARTWNAIPYGEASVAQHPKIVLAMGGYRLSDTLGSHGGYHGGYNESIKSPVIEPHRVHRFWKSSFRQAQPHIVQLGWNGTDASTAPKFYCGQSYHLRIGVKGSPVLRLLDHNIYHTFDVRTQCCVGTSPELVDPVAVFLSFARQINESVAVSQFLSATVLNAGGVVNPDTYVPLTDAVDIADVTAAIKLTAAYSDTRFGYFSFDPRDHFESEPVIISSAQLSDDSGDPCSLFKQLSFTQLQAGSSRQGSGDQVLRELILDNEYRQDPFPWDAREKEMTDFANLAAGVVLPTISYDSYYILFSTPRRYNPSGIYDNDQYLLHVCGEMGSDILADLETWFSAYLNSAATGVQMELMD